MIPKFKVGQAVQVTLRRHGRRGEVLSGTILELHRTFKEVEGQGFRRGGLETIERDIKSICLPYAFDGETLTVQFPRTDFGTWIQKAHSQVSFFYGYSYSFADVKGNRFLVSERQVVAR